MDERSSSLYCKQQTRNALTKKKDMSYKDLSYKDLSCIEFFKHNLSAEDKNELNKVLDSVFLTTGNVVKEFEDKFSQYLGTKHTVGVMSCTHALELCLRYFDIGPGDEVITTPMSFVATANVIEMLGAIPVFVDVEPHTGNIDATLIESAVTNKTKAILPVHLYGQMCDMRTIKLIADKYDLKIIEDCAHCVEGIRDGIRPGQLGDAACFSFYATKNLTSGEGGAVSCNNDNMFRWLISARQHGISSDAASRYTKRYQHYDMNFLGLKCNMSNLQAALLVRQIDRLDKLWEQRRILADRYNEVFLGMKGIRIMQEYPKIRHALHLYTILVDHNKRDEYLHKLQDIGIGVAVNYRPIHLMSYYKNKYNYSEGTFPVAESIGESSISLPFYPKLNLDDLGYITNSVSNLRFT